jgi:hypothetical protein
MVITSSWTTVTSWNSLAMNCHSHRTWNSARLVTTWCCSACQWAGEWYSLNMRTRSEKFLKLLSGSCQNFRRNVWILSIYFQWTYSILISTSTVGSRDSATGWTTEGSEFESRYGHESSLPYRVQTGSWAHSASYPMGTGRSFSGGKAAGAWSWTTHLKLVTRSRKCGSIHPLPPTPSWRSA